MSNEIVPSKNNQETEITLFLSPVASMEQLFERYNMFGEFVKKQLKSGTDYLVLPGSTKPSLAKPGAEKMGTFFGITPNFQTIDKVEDWLGTDHGGEPFFYYKYNCNLNRGARIVATCEGSCNSREVKYRYRQGERKCPTCGKAAIIKGKAEYGGGWLCFGKKGGCGAKFGDTDPAIVNQQVGRVINPDVADLVNTLQKMAQKRAFVGATLLATNASEYFTQDIEDMPQFEHEEAPVDATFTDVPTPQTKKAQPRERKELEPAALKSYMAKLAEENRSKPLPAELQHTPAAMEQILGGEGQRKELMHYLTGKTSFSPAKVDQYIGDGFVMAMYRWLKPAYSADSKTFTADPTAEREAHAAHIEALKVAGQQSLI